MKRLLLMIFITAALFTACSNNPQVTQNADDTDTISKQEELENQAKEQETEDKMNAEYEAFSKRLLEKSDYMPQFEEVHAGDTVAIIETSMGTIQVKLFPEEAPLAVENFTTHAKDGYYDGLIFHRVIADFMNQTGDPLGNGMGGESIWGTPFEDEFSPYMYQFRGALAMANSGANTNGSQFYIVNASAGQSDYFAYVDEVIAQFGDQELLHDSSTGKLFRTNYSEVVREQYEAVGGTPWLDYGHTVFGQVIEGMDIVDAINSVETDENDKPLEDVTIIGIEISIVE